MLLQESGEMYLETIYVLTMKSNFIRAVDVSDKLGYSKPSVSRAMGLLKSGGYINIAHDGNITLTEAGREAAHANDQVGIVLGVLLRFQQLLQRGGVALENLAALFNECADDRLNDRNGRP